MSQFPPALAFTLQWEDPTHAYAVVPDVGGEAIAGVNSKEWPFQYGVIAALAQDKRAGAVASFYQTCLWEPMQVGGITAQDLADRVFDEGVNAGASTSIRLLQAALNSIHNMPIAVDGEIGPITLAAVNSADPERLLAAFRQQRTLRYEIILKARPELEKYREGWMRRATA